VGRALYARLLGERWGGLHPSLRAAHAVGAALEGRGLFVVRHGDGRPARLVARLAGIPSEADGARVRVTVTPDGRGEWWRRTIGERPLVTRQSGGGDGILAERLGGLELRFRLVATSDRLEYRQVEAAIRVGSARLPLPRPLWVRVDAVEVPGDQPDETRVSVVVSLPLIGRLFSYRGAIRWRATPRAGDPPR
jgi:hypothetical protein